jgi:hypothetical protein
VLEALAAGDEPLPVAYVDAFRMAAAERPYARVRRVALTPKGHATVNK